MLGIIRSSPTERTTSKQIFWIDRYAAVSRAQDIKAFRWLQNFPESTNTVHRQSSTSTLSGSSNNNPDCFLSVQDRWKAARGLNGLRLFY
jgi:hypothetical protein